MLDLFLEKTPSGVDIKNIQIALSKLDGVLDVHHIHVWSLDGVNNYATLHVKYAKTDFPEIKRKIRDEMEKFGISHTTIEIEAPDENCQEKECHPKYESHHH